jgi:acetoin:2,6-dichlorophenolindophenol oxidoreductase subunit alpha
MTFENTEAPQTTTETKTDERLTQMLSNKSDTCVTDAETKVLRSRIKDNLTRFFRQMVTIRLFEERVIDLYRRMLIPGIAHVSIGQEAVPVGVCNALQRSDFITSTHRGHAHCLAKGAELTEMFSELFGKVTGYCRGKGGSMHIANPATGNLGANAIVGGSIPIATGAAFSAKLRESGQVAVCFFGDGAANQGVLLESMNLAAIWQLPVIYVCENNQYGEYTPMNRVTAGSLGMRGKAFGIRTAEVDGMDVIAVYEAACESVDYARSGKGPSFLVMETYRYLGHGMGDLDRPYRTREEENEWRQIRDPIDRLGRTLVEEGYLGQSDLDAISTEIGEQINVCVEAAQKAPQPGKDELVKHVYAD